MTERTCSFEGCDKITFARNWCTMHYSRWRRHGDPAVASKPKAPRLCTLEECERKRYARGWCKKHYQRFFAHNDPEKVIVRGLQGCAFPGCGKKHAAKGLCAAHWTQQHEGRELAPLQRRDQGMDRDALGRKLCRGCDLWLDLSHFTKNSHNLDGLMGRCRACVRALYIKRTYGITREQYQEMFDAQGGGCAACGGTDPDGQLVVDHDHACCPAAKRTCGRCVRGLLCTVCNMYLGGLGESIGRLTGMINYLRATSAGDAGAA